MKLALPHHVFQKLSQLAKVHDTDIYVIGGYVRDQLLVRPSKDIDILVIGDGIIFAERAGELLKSKVAVFKNFGTAMLRFDDLEIEFVGARKESYRLESRKPLVQNGTLQDDQNRRDFTINAMAISLNETSYGELLDPFEGLKHLEERIIKTPLEPELTFSDDPLRMLRAIRFATQLNFKIEAKTFEAICKNASRIQIVSKERITDELNKIISSPIPSYGFEYLFDSGLLKLTFPLMAELHGVEIINGKAHKDNFYHTLQVLDNISLVSNDLWMRWAAILHDIAKPATKRFEPGHGWTFHGHEDRGARMVPKIFAELKLPLNDKMKMVQKLVLLHLRPIVLAQDVVSDSAVRRLLFEAGEDIDRLMILCNADVTTKNEYKVKKYRQNFELVVRRLKEVEEIDQLRNWQPPITGDDIMLAFNLKAGREVGLIKNKIREAILEGEIKNNRDEAFEFMVKIGKELGLALVINRIEFN